MAAVLIGGVIVIWLGLSGGRAFLAWQGIELHRPVNQLAPLLLAILETVLFAVAVPVGALLPADQRGPMVITLIALAWLVNGAAAVWVWRRPA